MSFPQSRLERVGLKGSTQDRGRDLLDACEAGSDPQKGFLTLTTPEKRVREDHPIREIKRLTGRPPWTHARPSATAGYASTLCGAISPRRRRTVSQTAT
jgi:hypothetical protein